MPKRILTGTVTSAANEQTVTVSVERRFKHRRPKGREKPHDPDANQSGCS